MPKKEEVANQRLVVKMTKQEAKALREMCEDEVRTVGSWFRLQVRQAWRDRPKNKKPAKTFLRNDPDGETRGTDVWARLTESERDKLDILTDDDGVSVSIWFRRRLKKVLK